MSQFVAPWARGYGLAKAMIDYAVTKSKENSKNSIQLDIRETQTVLHLFESRALLSGKILSMLILMEIP